MASHGPGKQRGPQNFTLGLKEMIIKENNILEVIKTGQILLPIIITMSLILVLPQKFKLTALKIIIAILVGWVFSVLYTSIIYNVVAIEIAHGIENPFMKYDNNTTASMILVGWLIPCLSIIAYAFVCGLIKEIKGQMTKKIINCPTTGFTRT